MRKKLTIVIVLFFLASHMVMAQTDSSQLAKIYVIRSTGFGQSVVNFRLLVNNEIRCKIKNEHYSVFYLSPGTYVFNVTSFTVGKKERLGLELPVEAGNTYYLNMVQRSKVLQTDLFVEEITRNSAEQLLVKYKEDKKCD